MLKVSNLLNYVAKTFTRNVTEPQVVLTPLYSQVRNKYHQVNFYGMKNHWPQWSMMKDQKKRMILKNYAPYKLRYNAIRKSEILPKALHEAADYEIARVPREASATMIVHRCTVTSRGRGNVARWKLSRFIFRHLADYNKLAGVQRGCWA